MQSNYRIDVPEEAALLIVAWLLLQGRAEEARALIGIITPFFGRLRFFRHLQEPFHCRRQSCM
jgi:hypothetical protein